MRKLLLAFLILALFAGQAFAINDWIRGDGTDSVKGADSPSDNPANITNYMQDPLDRLLSNYVYGCTLTRTSATVITVSAGEVCCSNGAGTIKRFRKNTATTTITITGAGVAGLDSGSSEKASTLYNVYAVADADATTFTAIAAEDGVALSDVTYYRYIGSFFNNAAQDIDAFYWIGEGASVKVVHDDPYLNDEYRVLNGGTQTSFTNVDCSGIVPSSAVAVDVDWQPVGFASLLSLRCDGSSATNGFAQNLAPAVNMSYGLIENIPVSSRIFEYKVTGGTIYIWIKGYTFNR